MIVLLLLFCSALVFLGHRITKRRRRRWTESREEEAQLRGGVVGWSRRHDLDM